MGWPLTGTLGPLVTTFAVLLVALTQDTANILCEAQGPINYDTGVPTASPTISNFDDDSFERAQRLQRIIAIAIAVSVSSVFCIPLVICCCMRSFRVRTSGDVNASVGISSIEILTSGNNALRFNGGIDQSSGGIRVHQSGGGIQVHQFGGGYPPPPAYDESLDGGYGARQYPAYGYPGSSSPPVPNYQMNSTEAMNPTREGAMPPAYDEALGEKNPELAPEAYPGAIAEAHPYDREVDGSISDVICTSVSAEKIS